MDRRRFILAAGRAALLIPALAAAPTLLRPARAASLAASWGRTLVLVELAGGNDGLNTVVPYADPAYYRLRPELAVARDKVLPLDERLGLNPALEPLMPVWRQGELAVALGVGYPRPNRSHFRSIEIWESGTDRGRAGDGWLARLFQGQPRPAGLAADAIVLGGGVGAVAGGDMRAIVMRDPQQFLRRARRLESSSGEARNPALAHILRVEREIDNAAAELRAAAARVPDFDVRFPPGPFGRQLETAAKLIEGGVPVPVIKLSQSGYDTHSNQPGRHAALLAELGAGLAAFQRVVTAGGHGQRVLVMTYSEFGRRAVQNGSLGSDHGTAAPHFLLGGRVRGGLHGAQPSLGALEGGDLRHGLDFRQLYATVAEHWWGLPRDNTPFAGQRPLPLLKS